MVWEAGVHFETDFTIKILQYVCATTYILEYYNKECGESSVTQVLYIYPNWHPICREDSNKHYMRCNDLSCSICIFSHFKLETLREWINAVFVCFLSFSKRITWLILCSLQLKIESCVFVWIQPAIVTELRKMWIYYFPKQVI